MGEQKKDSKIVIRANNDFKKNYKILCELNGFTYSKRIIQLINKDIDFLKNLNG